MSSAATGATSRPTLVILGTAALNGGDAALLRAQRRLLIEAYGDVRVVAFDQQADVAARRQPDLELVQDPFLPRQHRAGRGETKTAWTWRAARLLAASVARRAGWRRVAHCLAGPQSATALETLAGASAAFTPGGTMLVPAYNYSPRLLAYTAALILRRPLTFFTQTMGPFPAWWQRAWLGPIVRRSRLVLVRGTTSRRHLGVLLRTRSARSLPPAVLDSADPVFALASDEALERLASPAGGLRRVAISVRDWPFFSSVDRARGQARFEEAVAALVTFLTERGMQVTFVSTCQGEPAYWADDHLTAQRVADRLAPEAAAATELDGSFHTTEELMATLATFDLVVATRLHAAILALAVGTPVVPIAYEHKTTEVFERLGRANWVLDIERIDPATLVERVTRAVDELDLVRPRLAAAVRAERHAAHQNADALQRYAPLI